MGKKYDWGKYVDVGQILGDIKAVRIQGATNVAIATLEGIKLYVRNSVRDHQEVTKFRHEVFEVGKRLALARENEPLAKNGVKYIQYKLSTNSTDENTIEILANLINQYCEEYLKMIADAKLEIIKFGKDILGPQTDEILTHCHSSTAENVIVAQAQRMGDFQVVCTETRPLFQGRITAKSMVDAGLSTTLIADSAVESYIIGRGTVKPDVVLIGADEITMDGDAINKIGSWGVALASYYANVPIYVVSSVLKVDPSTAYQKPQIEMREANEIWEEAPEQLRMVNPSFDFVNNQFITGFITEIGVIKPEDINNVFREQYGWAI